MRPWRRWRAAVISQGYALRQAPHPPLQNSPSQGLATQRGVETWRYECGDEDKPRWHYKINTGSGASQGLPSSDTEPTNPLVLRREFLDAPSCHSTWTDPSPPRQRPGTTPCCIEQVVPFMPPLFRAAAWATSAFRSASISAYFLYALVSIWRSIRMRLASEFVALH